MENRKAIILSDGRPGHFYQSLGLFEALQGQGYLTDHEMFRVNIPGSGMKKAGLFFLSPLKVLEKSLKPEDINSIMKASQDAAILIDTGSTTVPVARALGKLFPHLYTIHILSPFCFFFYDLVLLPEHDHVFGNHGNLLRFSCAFSRITKEMILKDAERVSPEIKDGFSSEAVCVLVGGDSKSYTMDNSVTETVAGLISANKPLHLTTSRRTPSHIFEELKEMLNSYKGTGLAIFVNERPYNPMPGVFGLCERILVTEDSFSMLSEAISSGLPVGVILSRQVQNRKIRKSIRKLLRKGLVFPIYGADEIPEFLSWSPEICLEQEQQRLVKEICMRIGVRSFNYISN